MRENIIKLLDFPRMLLQDNLHINIETCPHSCLYCKEDIVCLECHDESECEWLLNNGHRAELDKKNLEQLIHELEYAIMSVQALVSRWQHMSLTCQCEICDWLRTTLDLFDELRQTDAQIASTNNRYAAGYAFTTCAEINRHNLLHVT